MTSITILASETTVWGYALYGCPDRTCVYCKMPDPVSDSCDWDFPKEVMVNAVLYLPLGSKPKDETVGSWSGFAHIEETDYSGIGSVAAERTVRVVACHGMLTVEGFGNGEAVTAYDMNGRIVYIVTGGSLCSQSW